MKGLKYIGVSLIIAFGLGFSGCGGSDSTDDNTITGQFIDGVVEGADYTCSSGTNGVTNSNGEFTCNEDDTVTFSVAGIELGSVKAKSKITPYDLKPNNNEAAINMAQLLQTLDDDGDPSNGIKLDSTTNRFQNLKTADLGIDFTDTNFDTVVEEIMGEALVDAEQARTHMDDTIASFNNAGSETEENDSEADTNTDSDSSTDSSEPTTSDDDEFIYSTITSSVTGKVWMDRNLGASRACTSYDDEECYGDYYQWGRSADGHEKSNSGTTSTKANSTYPSHGDFITSLSSNNYDWTTSDSSGSTRSSNWNPCPSGYRIPTIGELEAENIQDRDDAFNKLKLPSAGSRDHSSGSMNYQGSSGYVWSSSVAGFYSRRLSFYSSNASTSYFRRAYGLSVRCLRD